MDNPEDQPKDITTSDRDDPNAAADDESRWLDEGGSNTQFQPADRVPVGDHVEPPEAGTVVRPPATDTAGDGR